MKMELIRDMLKEIIMNLKQVGRVLCVAARGTTVLRGAIDARIAATTTPRTITIMWVFGAPELKYKT